MGRIVSRRFDAIVQFGTVNRDFSATLGSTCRFVANGLYICGAIGMEVSPSVRVAKSVGGSF